MGKITIYPTFLNGENMNAKKIDILLLFVQGSTRLDLYSPVTSSYVDRKELTVNGSIIVCVSSMSEVEPWWSGLLDRRAEVHSVVIQNPIDEYVGECGHCENN